MRTTPLVVAILGLTFVSGCSTGPQRRDGDAAPAGSPSQDVSPSATVTIRASADTSPVAVPAGTRPPAATGTAIGPCQTANLSGEIDVFVREGSAGAQRTAALGLTNTGSVPCVLQGYPGIQLLAYPDQPRATVVKHLSDSQPERVTLTPGQRAWSELVWFATPNGDEADTEPLCGPQPIAARITPPGLSTSLRVTANLGRLCSHGAISVSSLSLVRPQ